MIDKEVEPGLTHDEKMYFWQIFSTEVRKTDLLNT